MPGKLEVRVNPPLEEIEGNQARPLTPLQTWIIRHDDSWLFTVGYVSLALVLSIWISLFWLVVVVAGHFFLEWFRQSHYAGEVTTILLRALWEIKLDIALVIFALVLTAYLELLLGLAGLGGAARLGLASGARVAGWSRAIRGGLLSLDDAAHVMRMAGRRMTGSKESGSNPTSQDANAVSRQIPAPWSKWNWGDRLSVSFGALCLMLILAAPFLTHHTYGTLSAALLTDLHPFPSVLNTLN